MKKAMAVLMIGTAALVAFIGMTLAADDNDEPQV